MKYVFLLTGEIDEAGSELLKKLGNIRIARSLAEDDLVHEVGEADALVVRPPAVITRKIIEAAGKLKVIGRHGVGYDNIDVKAATERGIPVTYTPSANSVSVAEHTIGLMFALAKKFMQLDEATRKGEWQARDQYEGIELNGKTCSLIGLGRVGIEVAKLAKSIGMHVLYFDVVRKDEAEESIGIEWVPFSRKEETRIPEKLLKKADFVSIHTPLTKETRGMIGKKELEAMKNGAFLVNTARGGLVDEEALHKAIRAGKLSGAALDVFDVEPLSPENPLLQLKTVIVTPHSAALTRESKERMGKIVAKDVVRVLEGQRPVYLVNSEAFK